jgi:hypothetical protein
MSRYRTRRARAEDIAARMVISLRFSGPATMPQLLARLGYDPATVRRVADYNPKIVAAIHMAIGELFRNGHPIVLAPSGRLYYRDPDRYFRMRARDRASGRSYNTDRRRRTGSKS